MELENYLEQSEEQAEGFVVDTEDKAVWAMRKLLQIKERINKRNETAQKHIGKLLEEIEKTKAWADQENENDKKSVEYFEGLLAGYGMNNLDGKKKSIKLPNGTLKLRKQQAKLQYNEELLLEKLKGTKYIKSKTVEGIDKAELRKEIEINEFDVTINGEKLEGVLVLEPSCEKWVVETDE